MWLVSFVVFYFVRNFFIPPVIRAEFGNQNEEKIYLSPFSLNRAMKKTFKVLFERQLILKNQETHSKSKLRILIGIPRWTEKGREAACPVTIEGWVGRVEDMRGNDPMHAMERALYFTNSLLKNLPPPKKLTWPNGDPYEGTFPDSSMVVSDALLRRLVKLQHQVISRRKSQDVRAKKKAKKKKPTR